MIFRGHEGRRPQASGARGGHGEPENRAAQSLRATGQPGGDCQAQCQVGAPPEWRAMSETTP